MVTSFPVTPSVCVLVGRPGRSWAPQRAENSPIGVFVFELCLQIIFGRVAPRLFGQGLFSLTLLLVSISFPHSLRVRHICRMVIHRLTFCICSCDDICLLLCIVPMFILSHCIVNPAQPRAACLHNSWKFYWPLLNELGTEPWPLQINIYMDVWCNCQRIKTIPR